MSTWHQQWIELPSEKRRSLYSLALCLIVFLIHFAAYSTWYIEDAAISFAFARNFASGEGFVAYPGGEPVEGFSNPSWTFLLVIGQFIGVNAWILAKLLGAVFGVLTLIETWRWTNRILPNRWATVAPLCLAVSPIFVMWCASGLENSLFTWLLAGAAVRLHRDATTGRGGSGWWWSALALTRPEGGLYAAVAAAFGLFLAIRHRQTSPFLIRFLPAITLPFAAWMLYRWQVFGWWLPNTYYAKIGETGKFSPLQWNGRGWKYIRGWAWHSGNGFLLPVYLLGSLGNSRQKFAWIASLIFGVLIIIYEITVDSIAGYFIIACLFVILFFAWLVNFFRNNGWDRALAGTLFGVAGFFALYSGGDWMQGWRWFSLGAVPLAILLAISMAELDTTLSAWAPLNRFLQKLSLYNRHFIPSSILLASLSALGVGTSIAYIGGPETSPYDVYRRVKYMQGVAQRLGLERVSLLEVDMGAHMWWSGFDLIDIAGLIDVPMGHHKYQESFIRQYVYSERDPEFAHVHGNWGGKRTKLREHPEWKRYVEIDPFPVSPTIAHVGNHVRRDLLVLDESPSWALPTPVAFEQGPTLVGFHIPAPLLASNGELYVEVAFSKSPQPFRALAVFHGQGQLWVKELPLALDQLPTEKLAAGESTVGRLNFSIPSEIPIGEYAISLVVLGKKDGVLTPPTLSPTPAYASREWPIDGKIQIVSIQQAKAAFESGVQQTIALADTDKCVDAAQHWTAIRHHLRRSDPEIEVGKKKLASPLARCWARQAETHAERDRPYAAFAIHEARYWDHHDLQVIQMGQTLADRWTEQGASLPPLERYPFWRDALIADPFRGDLRRETETTRDLMLGIKKPQEGGEAVEGGPE